MPRWIDDICTALENLGGIAHRSDIVVEVQRIRHGPHPPHTIETIQSIIQSHSSDTASGASGDRDLLYSVNGIGSGVWGLRSKLTSTPHANDIHEPDSASRVLTECYRILRDTEMARKIKLLHHNKCQICGETILLLGGKSYSEAHHIKPLGQPHNGPDTADNIIVLCPNHHVMFDYGALALNPDDIHPVSGHVISKAFIDYHNAAIFGKPGALP